MSNQTPEQQAAAAAHQALIEQLDMHSIHKSFRNPSWRPNQRRNKNIKTILGDATRKDAASSSIVATPLPQDNSGAATPANQNDNDDGLSTSGTSTPAVASAANGTANGASNNLQPNLAQASRSLSKLVLEKSLNGRTATTNSGLAVAGQGGAVSSAPSATYTNIESAPSLAHSRRYCDVTGLPAPYVDPKTRMRYHNRDVFAMIRSLPQGVAEQFLEARGAHTVLK
ncbi:hypothetical protein GE09DRAFT_1062229 [Coniochaeta sp. 2T2.1]|nr:hypothetical protein GE09DRAFT_1062229 [Coniochaeta sp. 2T2.1]